MNSIDRRCLDGSAWLRWKHAVGHGSMLVFVGSFRGITARVGNHAHSGTDTYKSWLFVGLCRTATSSVPLLGACAFSAFFAAFAAAFAALGVITCDSSSLPLEVVLTSDTATVLRGTVLPRELGLAPSVTPSPASMPVSSERSEEFSAAGAGAKARRVGLASSISRSCLIVRRVRHGGMGIVSVARRITEAYPRPSSQSESLIESAGRQTLRFLLTTAVPYLARGRATFAAQALADSFKSDVSLADAATSGDDMAGIGGEHGAVAKARGAVRRARWAAEHAARNPLGEGSEARVDAAGAAAVDFASVFDDLARRARGAGSAAPQALIDVCAALEKQVAQFGRVMAQAVAVRRSWTAQAGGDGGILRNLEEKLDAAALSGHADLTSVAAKLTAFQPDTAGLNFVRRTNTMEE